MEESARAVNGRRTGGEIVVSALRQRNATSALAALLSALSVRHRAAWQAQRRRRRDNQACHSQRHRWRLTTGGPFAKLASPSSYP
jgi:hypothetical protein